MYNSFGVCRYCSNGAAAVNVSTSADASDGTLVASRILFLTTLLVFFVFTACAILFATWHRKVSMRRVIFLARNLTLTILLTLQPAAFIGSVVKIVGADVLTPAHEVILAFYKTLTLDLTNVAPPSCSSGSSHQSADIVLALAIALA